jgi:hypothetical protein
VKHNRQLLPCFVFSLMRDAMLLRSGDKKVIF